MAASGPCGRGARWGQEGASAQISSERGCWAQAEAGFWTSAGGRFRWRAVSLATATHSRCVAAPEHVAAPALAGLNSVLGGLSGLGSGSPPGSSLGVPGCLLPPREGQLGCPGSQHLPSPLALPTEPAAGRGGERTPSAGGGPTAGAEAVPRAPAPRGYN